MRQISDIIHITSKVNDECLLKLANCLNEGYEIAKWDTAWVSESTDGRSVASVPVMIALLFKYED